MARLAVLGTGRVGGEVAFLAAALGIADELVLYDNARELLEAQVLDLRHTGLGLPISTDPNSIRETDVCILTAGNPRNPSIKTRADLMSANLPILNACLPYIRNYPGILITVANPMDVNNYYLRKMTGIDSRRCVGFGGQLDSARFGLALHAEGIAGAACVLGEHGEHQVPVFSTLPKKTVPVPLREEILAGLRVASMGIIRGKGGTSFGPAYHLTMLVKAIATDSRQLIACSSVLEGEYGITGCSLGVPTRIGKDGIHAIEEWKLDSWEQEKMNEAARFVGELCRKAVG